MLAIHGNIRVKNLAPTGTQPAAPVKKPEPETKPGRGRSPRKPPSPPRTPGKPGPPPERTPLRREPGPSAPKPAPLTPLPSTIPERRQIPEPRPRGSYFTYKIPTGSRRHGTTPPEWARPSDSPDNTPSPRHSPLQPWHNPDNPEEPFIPVPETRPERERFEN